VGDRERGWEVYGRQEQREWKVGFPGWREAGEKGNNYATLCNILQSKNGGNRDKREWEAGGLNHPAPPPTYWAIPGLPPA